MSSEGPNDMHNTAGDESEREQKRLEADAQQMEYIENYVADAIAKGQDDKRIRGIRLELAQIKEHAQLVVTDPKAEYRRGYQETLHGRISELYRACINKTNPRSVSD